MSCEDLMGKTASPRSTNSTGHTSCYPAEAIFLNLRCRRMPGQGRAEQQEELWRGGAHCSRQWILARRVGLNPTNQEMGQQPPAGLLQSNRWLS